MQLPNTVFLTLTYPPEHGGVGRMYKQLVGAIGAKNLHVYYQAKSPYESHNKQEHVAQLLNNNGWPRWRRLLWLLPALLRRHRARNVIIGQILPLGIPTWLLSHFLPGLTYQLFIHGMDLTVPARVKRKRWIIKKICQRSSAIFAANEQVARALREVITDIDIPIEILYPAPYITPAIRAVSMKQDITDKAPVLLTVSRLVPRKGIDTVLKSLPKLWETFPDLHYVIVGQGADLSRLQALSDQLAKPKQVHFMGAATDQEIAAWLKRAAIFVMAPHSMSDGDTEGLGIVYLEAASFGVPAIGTNHGGVPEAIVDGKTGYLVNEHDSSALADRVSQLLSEESLRQKMGEAARVRVANLFSVEQSTKKLSAALNRI